MKEVTRGIIIGGGSTGVISGIIEAASGDEKAVVPTLILCFGIPVVIEVGTRLRNAISDELYVRRLKRSEETKSDVRE
jgi:hypothetical protein